MRNDEREKQILQKLIKRFGTRWEAQAKQATTQLYEQIEAGVSITKAVANLRKEYGELFTLDGLQDLMTEAACYGYGIMPRVLTSTQHAEWGEALATAWDASGMTLSKKLHGTSVKMRNEIIRTLQTQMRSNKTWLEAARALYDGYSHGKNGFTGGKDIIRPQGIPKYMQKVLIATNDSQMAAAQRQALDNINRLARNGAPNKALQAAYNELLESAKKGSSQAMYKAARTAINEKCRYVAERIARTEMARAYADGFIAKISKDEDIAAVKFKLSGRHPTFDICDMYAKADMYNLGAGVYPKDKLPPLPVHPHCLCRYSEIIEGEVDMKKSADHVRAAGDKWLTGLSERQRRQVLGIEGLKAWESGKDWRKYMRGYAGQKKVRSRLQNVAPKATQAGAGGSIINTWDKITGEHTIEDDIRNANPNYSLRWKAYTQNCQRCVQAYELRRRGYNVIAKARNVSRKNDPVCWGVECFAQPKQGQSFKDAARDMFTWGKNQTDVKRELAAAPDNSTYVIYCAWNRRSAHVFIATKENGKVRYMDPQSGNVDVERYLKQGLRGHFGYCRIDDKPMTNDVNILTETAERRKT